MFSLETKDGVISVREEVVQDIAGELLRRNTLGEIRTKKGLTANIMKSIGRDVKGEGILATGEEKIELTCYLEVKFGVNLAVTGQAIQAMLKEELGDLVGMSIGDVKVIFTGVFFEEEEDDEQGWE